MFIFMLSLITMKKSSIVNLEIKAKLFATLHHKHQYRADGRTPYINHPASVVRLLKSIGIKDRNIICAGWLHDVIEDCSINKDYIKKEFNKKIEHIISVLTRNVGRREYLKRIEKSEYDVQIIKLCDVISNISDWDKHVEKKTIRRMLKDCNLVYIKLAKKLEPRLYCMLLEELAIKCEHLL